MATQRRDYILTQIELLGKAVARLRSQRDEAGMEEALQLAFNLQEKLLPLPATEFLQLDVDAQLAALRAGEAKAAGDEKCLNYARVLKETASLYEFRDRTDLAFGARQLALHVALCIALDSSSHGDAAAAMAKELHAVLDDSELNPPVLELLQQLDRARS
jgi:hypothetical protein